ncbi:MAG: GspE/PulE family protein, partial [Planctomycetota bacterium]
MSPNQFHELSQFDLHPETAQLLDLAFCQQKQLCILGQLPKDQAKPVTVAMLYPNDDQACREIEMRIGRRVKPIQLNEFEVQRAIRKCFKIESEESAAQVQVFLDYLRQIEFSSGQAPAKIVDDTLSAALTKGTTDIHIETYARDIDLRFRVDGVLRQIKTPISPDNVRKVISRIRVICNLDIAARPQPQEGRFSARYLTASGEDRHVHFRVSIIPSTNGEDCVIRILDGGHSLTVLDDLGMNMNSLHLYRSLLACPSGLILVTGPTGCGKTTTLYASVRHLQSDGVKICTVEDPAEIHLDKVNQAQVSEDNSFADFVRAFLRQDPDVMMVGEIRDEETAQASVRAAMTGHLVLATIHAQDAVSVVSRLRTLGIDDETLSTVFLGAVSQRLLRRNCKYCKEHYTPRADSFIRFYKDDPGHRFARGNGCGQCDRQGYQGRLGLFEVFHADDVLKAALSHHEPVDDIRERAKQRGYVPLVYEALQKVREGETTIEE